MNNVARRFTILTCVVLALVALGVSGFWLYGAERLKTSLAVWESHWRAEGGEVAYRGPTLSGFPLWFRLQFDQPMVARPQARSPWRWAGPPMRLRLSPFAPRGRAVFPGTHQLDLTLFNRPVALSIVADDALARYRSGGGEILYAVQGDGLRADIDAQHTVAIKHLAAEFVRLRGATDHTKPSARFAVEIEDMMLPQRSLPEPFRSRDIDLARLQGRVLGPFAPDFHRAAAAAWRDRGGTVEIEALELRWGALNIVAVGTMALDENLQPLAALTATITGFNQAIDALTSAGTIRKDEAEAAKTLLGLLAKPPLLGGPREITVPITIQNQRLSIGPVALLMLPLLEWPD